ncbi:class I SAM-dependent methyltransferase [Alicyclobacillus dauci]|uniref:Class I SAM-dependent methyltransferase n=1 Tax=Alicyclobacillus dauci TaxID=1475485 RepID=A0ABY6Z0R6_9BACL|nr:class I SAM-dependent methyltransferase [Alicyclobacillus dauci]WAH36437.1 class I SAM-dependent methyltransferase [Alicyclobacillus dauci]
MGHRFNPKHIEKLDNPERRKALPPDKILNLLDVQEVSSIADIGCGPGYFTLPVAHMTEGTVYGIDVSPEMLRLLEENVQREGLSNVSLVESTAERIALPDESVDRIICSLVLHEVDDLKQTLSEFKRILRADGKILLIEWEKKPMDMGPPVEERLDPETLLHEVEILGFHGQISYPNPNHYIILAE